MVKTMANVSLLSILCLAVTACGGGGNNGNAAGTAPATNTTAAPAANEPVKNEKLIVYTNANSDGRGEWLIEKAKSAGFEIELVGAGGANLTNRLIAEKNNPIADVVFGLNNMLYENLKKENVLTKYVPKWAGEVEPGLNDPEGYYHGLVKQAILLGYNPKHFTAETAPKDWTDLYKDAAFKGKYEAPTLLGQITPQLVVAGILTRHQDPKGELGISQEGWNEVKQLFDNGVRAVEGEDFYSNLASGKTPLGAVVSGTLSKKEEQYKVKAGIVNPSIGVPMIVEHAAIINGTKKKASAERFVEWMGTAEVQGEFASKFNSMPANTKAAAKANESVKALYSNLKAQPLDWGFIAGNIGKWVEKIELQIMI
ncbi:extracellular solute-binding protein [Paenibacillus mucilaginosus]|uniref:Extracellular solute-binding protein family 1 n=1 Tax=Paenibacillus mucilaginosus (strain KNP414) TaxID=1036673 RepID=F8F6E8_PAEMK|nr:extracellular solute-binding protein [Paenibacillus mucilaginosus]AEI42902.1 extracellular solute-binding protein family 1 [Paenibacillus mucilaginosus KNP414]MCG7216021.1 extracellular solute-binding protein [Paenibacillus mucilaginosus]WDM31065.1 extracellular solute-binding protein [Paenibacillus mucilaginosus]